jgi:hypothetical protein
MLLPSSMCTLEIWQPCHLVLVLCALSGTIINSQASFTSKHDRSTSFMIRNRMGCWKPDLVGLGFPPFCWIFRREMGQNGVPGQLLLRFAPLLLQWYSLLKCRLIMQKWQKSGQLVVRYDRLAEGVNWANVLEMCFFDANHVWLT